MIDVTGFKYDLSKLKGDYASFGDEEPIVELSHADSHPGLGGRWVLNEDVVGTETDSAQKDVLVSLPPPLTTKRVSFITVDPEKATHLHGFDGYTFIIPVYTNEHTFVHSNTGRGIPKRLIEGNMPMMLVYGLPADGRAYVLDGTKYHYISNVGSTKAVFLVIETNRLPVETPKWTGLTSERMTGHEDFLEQDLRPGFRFNL